MSGKKSLLDPAFKYTPSHETDIGVRVRRYLREQKKLQKSKVAATDARVVPLLKKKPGG